MQDGEYLDAIGKDEVVHDMRKSTNSAAPHIAFGSSVQFGE